MNHFGFAAITLDRSGGGVAVASQLLWQVLSEAWPGEGRLMTLVDVARNGSRATTAARLRFGMRLASVQAFGDCDWIFCSHLAVAQVQQYLPVRVRKPYAVFLHGIEVWRALTPAQLRVLQGARLLVANSAYTVKRVSAAHPGIGPIVACPLALPRDSTAAAPSTAAMSGAATTSPSVLLVGRMVAAERYKGHDQLLEAWPAVLAQSPLAQLVFVGTGDDAARLKEKARELGIEASVVFTGFVAARDLAALYQRGSVFAMPSRGEGFGLAYLEAMAHQLPCIGSRHDAAGDLIVDGTTGFLVEQDDAATLADRIVTLLTDEALRTRMGRAGCTRAREHFSYEAFRGRLVDQLSASFGSPEPALVRASRL